MNRLGDTLFPRLISRGLIEAAVRFGHTTWPEPFPRLISRGLIEAVQALVGLPLRPNFRG